MYMLNFFSKGITVLLICRKLDAVKNGESVRSFPHDGHVHCPVSVELNEDLLQRWQFFLYIAHLTLFVIKTL
ncbi:hypothetical protein FZC78_08470 [Rossellomorea vietnamensis]|uniref:Uncharacterized protein n=1 Tax=Rossellomorea vietnamensis TaxID=218284 RepID=A0A5D4NWP8_9BACI|nr:hypothetical protein [Rossellomorea vietnamensis]TYS17868.1 hypothetical protein FZC78_08470 [Rossellomorea vietnamensis]